jgi:acyl-coenzyme A synthetase/AMP-(fatty) acid ligase
MRDGVDRAGLFACVAANADFRVDQMLLEDFYRGARNVASAASSVRASPSVLKIQVGGRGLPREIFFIVDLPKTATGKIQRFKLREPAFDA